MSENESVTPLEKLLGEAFAQLQLEFTALQMNQCACHFSLLLKWNAQVNLTSLKDPREIAYRHFGESLFLTRVLQPSPTDSSLIDVGSGGGFPGLPLKVAWPWLRVVLLEPNHKKAAFLKEVIRTCSLKNAEVRAERVEAVCTGNLQGSASLVVLRAVALGEDVLDQLRRLLAPGGRVALFLGTDDSGRVETHAGFEWTTPVPILHSHHRVILVGRRC
ncbi:MAG: 16S rRNA (guanine(527)-N(7))-methyltransferase RsmG [Acidobacteria bacterium]|nr:16S rRNA (guanine(527)-N(7))-methyltransferase RsmG [Acidobacteriota bacterium]